MSQLMDKGILFSLATALTWAFTVILMRKAGDSVSPLPLNVIRYSIAILGFVLTLIVFPEEPFPSLSAEAWGRVLVSGILGGAVGDFFYLQALNRIGAGTLAILDLAYLPLMALFSFLIWGDRMGTQASLGAALVATGVGLATVRFRRRRNSSATPLASNAGSLGLGLLYAGLALGSIVACALMIGDVIRHESILWISLIRYGAALGTLLIIVRLRKLGPEVQRAMKSSRRRWAIVFSSFFGAYGASLFWFLGFKYAPMGVSSALNQTSSLFIIVLARVFLGETLSLRKVLAIIVGFLGALLVGAAGV